MGLVNLEPDAGVPAAWPVTPSMVVASGTALPTASVGPEEEPNWIVEAMRAPVGPIETTGAVVVRTPVLAVCQNDKPPTPVPPVELIITSLSPVPARLVVNVRLSAGKALVSVLPLERP